MFYEQSTVQQEHGMDGIIDLNFETHPDLANIPTAACRSWLAADLSPAEWTIPLSNDAIKEVRSMVRAMQASLLQQCCVAPSISKFRI